MPRSTSSSNTRELEENTTRPQNHPRQLSAWSIGTSSLGIHFPGLLRQGSADTPAIPTTNTSENNSRETYSRNIHPAFDADRIQRQYLLEQEFGLGNVHTSPTIAEEEISDSGEYSSRRAAALDLSTPYSVGELLARQALSSSVALILEARQHVIDEQGGEPDSRGRTLNPDDPLDRLALTEINSAFTSDDQHPTTVTYRMADLTRARAALRNNNIITPPTLTISSDGRVLVEADAADATIRYFARTEEISVDRILRILAGDFSGLFQGHPNSRSDPNIVFPFPPSLTSTVPSTATGSMRNSIADSEALATESVAEAISGLAINLQTQGSPHTENLPSLESTETSIYTPTRVDSSPAPSTSFSNTIQNSTTTQEQAHADKEEETKENKEDFLKSSEGQEVMSPAAKRTAPEENDLADYDANKKSRQESPASGKVKFFQQPLVYPPVPMQPPRLSSTSKWLRSGARLSGTQYSPQEQYTVDVQLSHVDLEQSTLCGELIIKGLTEEHPVLTTFFEGEIIGKDFTFLTNHPTWGATASDDYAHWSRFTEFMNLGRDQSQLDRLLLDHLDRPWIFMRWKEEFLLTNPRVSSIAGASFDGFYYVCFNQVTGQVNGLYFLNPAEPRFIRFQRLELRSIPTASAFAAYDRL